MGLVPGRNERRVKGAASALFETAKLLTVQMMATSNVEWVRLGSMGRGSFMPDAVGSATEDWRASVSRRYGFGSVRATGLPTRPSSPGTTANAAEQGNHR
ncbi:MAG: hypothetical protein V3V08_13610 [Nannocystaceae bacterium]